MNKVKVVFLGGKEIGVACLKLLLEAKSNLPIEIVGVFGNDRRLSATKLTVRMAAEECNIPYFEDIQSIHQLGQIDLLISVQYHLILTPNQIAASRVAVNYHMAPLPEYRGCNQFSFAIIDKAKTFGTTLHMMNAGIDAGDIIDEIRFEVPNECMVYELYDLTYHHTIQLFERNIQPLVNGDFKATPQTAFLAERSSGFHLRKEIEQAKLIDAAWPIERQKRYFRATYFPPFSPPMLKLADGTLQPLDINWYRQA